MNKKSTKRKPLTQEQIDKRTKTVFKRKIRNIFTGMGFTYVPTNDHEMVIGLRKVELMPCLSLKISGFYVRTPLNRLISKNILEPKTRHLAKLRKIYLHFKIN